MARASQAKSKPSETAKVSFVFANARREIIVSKLPQLTSKIGGENCYSSEGLSLAEISAMS
jgi:hypothetical protein